MAKTYYRKRTPVAAHTLTSPAAVGIAKSRRTHSDEEENNIRASPLEAIDPRTQMVLFKMLNGGVFNYINGATGKEVAVFLSSILLIPPFFFFALPCLMIWKVNVSRADSLSLAARCGS
ncbi:Uncharacterized protein Fot_51340 [Forsythia ovata]|uniref:Uncharacterized protein n=1 Tax=Forsythia ovata TaxID=205694 RepID=A0ABD1PVC0_9LAMI